MAFNGMQGSNLFAVCLADCSFLNLLRFSFFATKIISRTNIEMLE